MGVWGHTEKRNKIKGLMNSKPPVGKAMPDLTPRQVQSTHAQCPHPAKRRRERLRLVNVK